MNTPEELLKFMANFSYEWMDKEGIFHNEIIPDMYESYSLMSPEEVLKYKRGICMDQSEFERYWFEKFNLDFKVLKIELKRNDSAPGHIFVIYRKDNKWYWFENAWYDERGIHKYDTYEKLINDIKNKFSLCEKITKDEYSKITITEHPKYPFHLSYEEMDNYNFEKYKK